MYDYDVLFLGSGHGAFDGGIPLGLAGKKVAVIERDLLGGTCPNRGCNPKITLDQPVVTQRANEWQGKPQVIDWPANIAHKHAVIDTMPDLIKSILDSGQVDIIKGNGVFKDAHTVMANGKTITADKIVIATGLRPKRLDVPGTELAHTSDDFLNLENMPKRMVVIGAGFVGMELATIANAAGADVTILVRGDEILKSFYQPYVQIVVNDLKMRGVKFITQANVTAISNAFGQLAVNYNDTSIMTDWILDATGRTPNVENIGLEALGIAYNANGIVVNDQLQTSVPNIYADGDVLDKPGYLKLTPTATYESKYLYRLFTGQTTEAIHYPAVASAIFTSPRIAQVGVPIAEAKAKTDQYTVVEQEVAADWYRQARHEKIGRNALVFDQAGHLVGASEVSEAAEDVINYLLPYVQLGVTREQLNELLYIFPSIGAYTHGLV